MSSSGLLVFHPLWTDASCTVLKPEGHWNEPAGISARLQAKVPGYVPEGLTPVRSDGQIGFQAGHSCRQDYMCPNTIRHTQDDRVLFVPFSVLDAHRGKGAVGGPELGCMWRHGGLLCEDGATFHSPCAFPAPNLSGGFRWPFGAYSSNEVIINSFYQARNNIKNKSVSQVQWEMESYHFNYDLLHDIA